MYPLTRTSPSDLSCLFKGANRKTIIKQYDALGSVMALRQMPENHCLAVRSHTEWVISQDPAANRSIMYVIFELLFYHDLKWDATGNRLFDAIDEIVKCARNNIELDTNIPRGILTSIYRCPGCSCEDFSKVGLMPGGANCKCSECGTLFHVCAY